MEFYAGLLKGWDGCRPANAGITLPGTIELQAMNAVDYRKLDWPKQNQDQQKLMIEFRLILSASKPWPQLLSADIRIITRH